MIGLASEPQRDPDDFDLEAWVKNHTLPMELAPARVTRLKGRLEAHGFTAVQVKYTAKLDRYRILMRVGRVTTCGSDDQAEDWLRRAAEESNAEPRELIGLVTGDGHILGTFRGGLPREAGRG